MARHYDDSNTSTTKTRRQEEDRRRMAFRRAIEAYSEERRLKDELNDFDASSFNFWQAPSVQSAIRNARPAR